MSMGSSGLLEKGLPSAQGDIPSPDYRALTRPLTWLSGRLGSQLAQHHGQHLTGLSELAFRLLAHQQQIEQIIVRQAPSELPVQRPAAQ
jgi:hypothetical protein